MKEIICLLIIGVILLSQSCLSLKTLDDRVQENENLSPEDLLTFFLQNIELNQIAPDSNLKSSLLCKGCQLFTVLLGKYPTDGTIAVIEQIIARICSLFGLKLEVCSGAIMENGKIVVRSITKHYFSSEFFAGKL